MGIFVEIVLTLHPIFQNHEILSDLQSEVDDLVDRLLRIDKNQKLALLALVFVELSSRYLQVYALTVLYSELMV